MIREGKRAKVTNCKQAKTLSPILASTQSPQSVRIRDGYENAKAVKKAVVVTPELQQERVAEVHLIKVLQNQNPAVVTMAEPVGSMKAQTKAVNEEAIVEEKAQMKDIQCKNVKKDITLKSLFRDWKES